MMKKIKILLFLGLIITAKSTLAQQDPQYTQYMYNMSIVNPAYAGSQETLSIGLLGRTQWVGLAGAPQTITASVNAPINDKIGVGFSAIADEIGPIKEQNLYADFSYTIETSREGKLAFGIKGGFTFQDINYLGLSSEQLEIPAFTTNLNEVYPNVGAGIFYYNEKFYASVSMPNMLKARHFEKSNGYNLTATEDMHYFISSGYVFDISQNLKFKPSFMAKAVSGAPVSIDLSANALINDKFEVGLSWRADDSISAMVNLLVTSDFRIGYAYDYTLSNLGQFNDGSHEIFLLYNINSSKDNMKSPRFF